MACQALLAKHPAAWRGAVTHKFLAECQRGEIGENQFDTWLVQVGLGTEQGSSRPCSQPTKKQAAQLPWCCRPSLARTLRAHTTP